MKKMTLAVRRMADRSQRRYRHAVEEEPGRRVEACACPERDIGRIFTLVVKNVLLLLLLLIIIKYKTINYIITP